MNITVQVNSVMSIIIFGEAVLLSAENLIGKLGANLKIICSFDHEK